MDAVATEESRARMGAARAAFETPSSPKSPSAPLAGAGPLLTSTVSAQVQEQMRAAKANLESKVGGAVLTCARCGHPIEKNQKVVSSGMMRYHDVCPSAEEVSRMVRNTKFFLKKLPERMVLTLSSATGVGAAPLSFMYDVDKAAMEAAGKAAATASIEVPFVADQGRRASMVRKLAGTEGASAKPESFDVKVRDFPVLTFVDPRTGAVAVPTVVDVVVEEEPARSGASSGGGDDSSKADAAAVSLQAKDLTITKFTHANGVLQTLRATFRVYVGSSTVVPRDLSVKLEMWLPDEVTVAVAVSVSVSAEDDAAPAPSGAPTVVRRKTYVAKKAMDFDVT